MSLPQRMQLILLLSFGHSRAKCPNSLQFRHFIVGLVSLKYLDIWFLSLENASSSVSDSLPSADFIFSLVSALFSSTCYLKYMLPLRAPPGISKSGFRFVDRAHM